MTKCINAVVSNVSNDVMPYKKNKEVKKKDEEEVEEEKAKW